MAAMGGAEGMGGMGGMGGMPGMGGMGAGRSPEDHKREVEELKKVSSRHPPANPKLVARHTVLFFVFLETRQKVAEKMGKRPNRAARSHVSPLASNLSHHGTPVALRPLFWFGER